MTSVRSALLVAVLAILGLLVPTGAGAEPLPLFDGAMTFHSIQGPEGPEEFSWEVNLGENQELRQVDERNAAVYSIDPEHLNFSIAAIAAHDAVGTDVPTTLAVTQPNVLTLEVHHRVGNPATGGAPFEYPVNAGNGWEGGFQVHQVQGPPDQSELRATPLPAPVLEPRCAVPDVVGRTLAATRKMLQRSHCRLGQVRGERSRGARVVRQYRRAGKSLPAGAEVGVKVLRP